MNEIKNYSESIFESIKHVDEFGNEFWYARELQNVLEYKEWRKFNGVIDKAMNACLSSKNSVLDHFVQLDKMIQIAKGAKRKVLDYKLSRYACYLIAQNGDSHIKAIALVQTYFAVQTRKMELTELEYEKLSEDQKRLYRRKQASDGNYSLNRTAVKSGVKNLAEFHNAGYKGLYNGETANDIFKRKKLEYREDILDNMSSEELGANIFRITQTEAKLKRDKVDNEYTANSVHYEIGKKVRNAIIDMGGTMPEDLPTPSKSLKQLGSKNEIT
ncbi:MAG: DNA damage-inducible protein D [Bacilli bacterium]